MPRIFDNIDQALLPTLQETLALGHRGDFCVGYFNLRGWRHLAPTVEAWAGGEGACARLLVGMPVDPEAQLRREFSLLPDPALLDNATVVRLKRRMAEKFREQLTLGAPTGADQAGLQTLSRQLEARKVVVRLHLRYPLHAKLYLAHRVDPEQPHHRLPRQQQPHERGPAPAGRAERGRAGPRRHGKAPTMVRGALGGQVLPRHHRRVGPYHRRVVGDGAPAVPRVREDGVPPLLGGPHRDRGVRHPARLPGAALQIPGGGGADRRASPRQARRGAAGRRRRPRQDDHGGGGRAPRHREERRGAPHRLPAEPRPHVAELQRPVRPLRPGAVLGAGGQAAGRVFPPPPRDHRREP